MKDFLRDFYQNSGIGFYLLRPVVMTYHYFLLEKYLSKESFIKKRFKKHFGFDIDLQNPKTLNEKINWLKLNDDNPLLQQASDKYAVRSYVKDKIGNQYLVPLLYTTLKHKDIRPENLPDIPFIIKTNHNSSGGIIIRDKKDEKIDWKSIRNSLRWNMSENYYWNSREPQYKNIKPRIIVEKLLMDSKGNIPFDYKLHYFNGKLAFAQVDSDRMTDHKRNLYSDNWENIDCEWAYKVGKFIEEPSTFKKMKKLGEKFAEDFKYVRVDFYTLGEEVYFGELTFHSDGGVNTFKPHKYDIDFGNMLNLKVE